MEDYPAMKGNSFDSVLMRQMNLEPIKKSEVSQREKDKYCILMDIYGIQKVGADEPSFRAAMEIDREETCGHKVEGSGLDEMRLQHSNIYVLPYIKLDRRWKFSV